MSHMSHSSANRLSPELQKELISAAEQKSSDLNTVNFDLKRMAILVSRVGQKIEWQKAITAVVNSTKEVKQPAPITGVPSARQTSEWMEYHTYCDLLKKQYHANINRLIHVRRLQTFMLQQARINPEKCDIWDDLVQPVPDGQTCSASGKSSHAMDSSDLPSGWSRRCAGRMYYVDHRNRTTTWDCPNSSK
jgi:hypothetical protein